MFQLTNKELTNLKSQFVISSWGGRRHNPYVFTEHGILMLSSILNSKRAISVNIQIVRTFARLREMLVSNELLRSRIESLESKFAASIKEHDARFKIIFDAIKKMLEPAPLPEKKKTIGFHNR
jgi:hypothetical protein